MVRFKVGIHWLFATIMYWCIYPYKVAKEKVYSAAGKA
jgi:hypothetical protein